MEHLGGLTKTYLNRREALGLFVGGGALLALTACASEGPSLTEAEGTTPSASGSPATGSAVPLPSAPPQLENSIRDLTIRLWAEPGTATIVPGVDTDVYTFGAEVVDGDPASVVASGSYLGPTLRVHQGQRVRVTFENRLPDESIVHWHGLVVPQDQDGQPAEAVPNDGVYEYDFVIENKPGTYWYHPHPHARTGEQVYQGLAGLLIIHGEEPELPSGDNDIAVVLQDRTIGSDGQLRYLSNMMDRMTGFVGDTIVTNGVTDFAVGVKREPYRVRLLNGANSRTQFLTLSTGDALTAIATDGNLLPEPVSVEGLVMTPAQRTDLWVDFSRFEAGQTIELLTADVGGMNGMMGGAMGGGGMGSGGMGSGDTSNTVEPQVAATFVVTESEAVSGTIPSPLGSAPDFDASDATNSSNPRQFVLTTPMMSHAINGLQWEGRTASEVETVSAGDVELWEFVSQSPIPHPMHLHGAHFRVVDRSWTDTAARDTWDAIADGVIDTGLRDTVLVWPGQRVQLAVPYAPYKGYFLYHCHILEHEDDGMMRNFLVE